MPRRGCAPNPTRALAGAPKPRARALSRAYLRRRLRATACVDRSSGDAFVVFNGFGQPSGQDYELWALRGDRVESMGVIRVGANGHAVVHRRALSEPDQLTALAVSLEPAGGSPGPAPTGPVLMVGALGG